jgi:transcriptional regulator with XRE-family HTH domain
VTGSNGRVDIGQLPIEERVRAIRQILGWKQSELADEVGLNVRQIKRFEAGGIPSEESAHAIADLVARLRAEGEAPRWLKVPAELLFEPREKRMERVVALERRVDQLERRLRKAGL